MKHIYRVVDFHPSIVLMVAFLLTIAVTMVSNLLVSTVCLLAVMMCLVSAYHRLSHLRDIDVKKLGAKTKVHYRVSVVFVVVSLIAIITYAAYGLISTYGLAYFSPGADAVLASLKYVNPFLLFGAIGASGRVYRHVMKHDWVRDEIEQARQDRLKRR